MNLEFSTLIRLSAPEIPPSLLLMCLDYTDYMHTSSCLSFTLDAEDGIQVFTLISTLPTEVFPPLSEKKFYVLNELLDQVLYTVES